MTGLATSRVFVPSANETYAYDADGNQTLVTTGTGAWQVEYNGENRPVRWTCGDKVLHMAYDHQGRRRFYVEVAAGVTNKLHRFTYDDYVCIARSRDVDATYGVGSDAFVWDPTEPIATRPLMCNPSIAPPFLYCHDGNKNVSETVSLYGTIAAHYDYSSFGKVVLVTSENEDQSTANLNPYRFSSEYADDALGLVYYNYRHLNANCAVWLSRDRKGEETSFNIDNLGLDVHNNSKCPVIVKKEDDKDGTEILMPGKVYLGKQDGIYDCCKSNPNCVVYKTVNNVDATVTDDGIKPSGGGILGRLGQLCIGGCKDDRFLSKNTNWPKIKEVEEMCNKIMKVIVIR